MACAFKENSCEIGVILGTGSNACYMEKIEKCPKLKALENDEYPKEVRHLRRCLQYSLCRMLAMKKVSKW